LTGPEQNVRSEWRIRLKNQAGFKKQPPEAARRAERHFASLLIKVQVARVGDDRRSGHFPQSCRAASVVDVGVGYNDQ
jgi:hypothetical protein